MRDAEGNLTWRLLPRRFEQSTIFISYSRIFYAKKGRREWLRSCVASPLLLPQQKRPCQYHIHPTFPVLPFSVPRFTNSEILSYSPLLALSLCAWVSACVQTATGSRANVFVCHFHRYPVFRPLTSTRPLTVRPYLLRVSAFTSTIPPPPPTPRCHLPPWVIWRTVRHRHRLDTEGPSRVSSVR